MSAVLAAAGPGLDEAAREWIRSATAFSRFAGPDGEGVQVLEGGVALGQCRLAADGETPPQPLTLDGRVWLSADVRLDNRAGLFGALRAAGQPAPRAATDPELVLRAYGCWGERFLERVAGDFAFALWDVSARRLVCARDQIGVAPLHYAVCGETVFVSSALDALRLHPDVPDDLDERAMADFLLVGRALDFGATAYAEIRRLPPAHVLTWSGGRVRLRRYWRQPVSSPLLRFRRPPEYVARFRGLLELAVADRVPADGVAVHLSGGMDSTTIAALAVLARRPRGGAAEGIRAVTAVLGGSSGDQEGEYAALVARGLGVPLDVVDDSRLPATDPYAVPVLRLAEPNPYSWTGIQLEVARRALDPTGVCLTGIGGDALLWFNPGYWVDWLAAGHPWRVIAAMADHARVFGERPRPHLRQGLLAAVSPLRVAGRSVPGWLAHDFAGRAEAVERMRASERLGARTLGPRSLTEDPWWQTWTTRGDPSLNRLALRHRHPLLDLRLLDFASRIPPYPWLLDKRILREATADVVPDSVRRRPKTPLVEASRPGTEETSVRRLAEFVREVPEADQFIDRERLAQALLAPREPLASGRNSSVIAAIGLVHWLAHRTQPTAEAEIPPRPHIRRNGVYAAAS